MLIVLESFFLSLLKGYQSNLTGQVFGTDRFEGDNVKDMSNRLDEDGQYF